MKMKTAVFKILSDLHTCYYILQRPRVKIWLVAHKVTSAVVAADVHTRTRHLTVGNINKRGARLNPSEF